MAVCAGPNWWRVLGRLLGALALGAALGLCVPVGGRAGWALVASGELRLPTVLLPWQRVRPVAPEVATLVAARGPFNAAPRIRLVGEPVCAGLADGSYARPELSPLARLSWPQAGPDALALSRGQQFLLRWPVLSPAPIGAAALGATVPIINWHDVIDGEKLVSFDVTVDEFEAQLDRIAAEGAHPITLRHWWRYLTEGAELPTKPVLLTFDDGYASVYSLIYPRLKARGWPAVFFIVPTTVGRQLWSKDHLTWDQAREMQATGLYEFQGHSFSHPYPNLLPLDDAKRRTEVAGCRWSLEKYLRRPCQFLCYPNGRYDQRLIREVERAGYVAAFTTGRGGTAQSRSVWEIQRYDNSSLGEALAAADAGTLLAAGTQPPSGAESVKLEGGESVLFFQRDLPIGGAKVPLAWAIGGKPVTVHADFRYAVGDVADLAGAAAAINGSFFQLARVRDISNAMLGPVMSQLTTRRDAAEWRARQLSRPELLLSYDRFIPGEPQDVVRLLGRPLVLISPDGVRFEEFALARNSRRACEALAPGLTDAFVAGGWLVRDGVAVTKAEMDRVSTKDHNDFRRRAWFGIDKAGHPAVGASPSSQRSEVIAKALEQIGIAQACLLDSGFSSSLYFAGNLFVTGHSDAQPSRPVPHMILLQGTPDAESVANAVVPDLAKLGNDPGAARASRAGGKGKRRKR